MFTVTKNVRTISEALTLLNRCNEFSGRVSLVEGLDEKDFSKKEVVKRSSSVKGHKSWSEEDTNYLMENFKKMGAKRIGKVIGRTSKACALRASLIRRGLLQEKKKI